MIANEYVPLARRTLKEFPFDQHLIHMALGLCGEMGEFIDTIKAFVVYGKGIDPSGAKDEKGKAVVMLVREGGVLDLHNLNEEAGDDFWYVANLLPELGVSPNVLQRAIDVGFTKGTQARLSVGDSGMWTKARMLLELNVSIALISLKLANSPEMFKPESSFSVQIVEGLGEVMGTLCGVFDLDPTVAMDLNIKKLAKRYGDKFSDVAAVNRDVGAERVILEGGATGGTVAAGVYLVGEQPSGAKSREDFSGEQLRAAYDATPANVGGVALNVVPEPVVDLGSDKPLDGGSCAVDGPCEGCQ